MNNMRVFLLGSTGRLGNEILKKLVLEKIHVQILVRDPKKINIESQYVSIFKGHPGNSADLDKAMYNCNVIISSLNISRNSDFPWAKLRTPVTLLSDTMTHLVDLTSKHSIEKIITISAWGVNESKSELPFWFKWIINNSNIKPGYSDHGKQEDILMKSNSNWTIIRPVGLSNSKRNKAPKISIDTKPPNIMVSRKTVAKFVVDNLNNNTFNRKIVTIS